MTFRPPERLNIADLFLDARVREGLGERTALHTDERTWTYREVRDLADRFAGRLRAAGVRPEERVVVSLPDGAPFVGALFGVLKLGAVGVMVNPAQGAEDLQWFLEYTRARAAVVDREREETFREAARGVDHLAGLLVVGDPAFQSGLEAAEPVRECFPSHRDDPALWLFSGGTTGKPKGVVQPHRSFANTTALYGRGVLGLTKDDVTLSVPKLFFGYATGSNLFFPFSVGASAVLFPERCTPAVLFEKIERFRPTILVNVPTMVGHLVADPSAAGRDLSSLRLSTSAGEALPVELHRRWDALFGVDLLDGLGTAEMWHIFLSNRAGDVRPGTLGRPVPGFDVRVRDDDGTDLPDGEVGWLWVRGGSRALGYWQHFDRTVEAFRGPWYVSGDMVERDPEGFFRYRGRGDDMLKVSGKWLSPQEVENCLLQHEAVSEVAVVGVRTPEGLVKPHAFVVRAKGSPVPPEVLEPALQDWVKDRLAPYKYPRRIRFLDALPRTHLGKVDRGALRDDEAS